MNNLLHLDSSIQGDRSVSRILSQAIVDHLAATCRPVIRTYRDLASHPIAHLTDDTFLAMGRDGEFSPAPAGDVALG